MVPIDDNRLQADKRLTKLFFSQQPLDYAPAMRQIWS
jgi:hypothetical protein